MIDLNFFAAILDYLPVKRPVALALVGLFAVLIIGSIVRLVLIRSVPSDKRKSRLDSLKTWWILAILFSGVVIFGLGGAVVFFGLASLLGLKEYLSLTAEMRRDHLTDALAFAVIPVQYLLIYLEWVSAFTLFIPVAVFLLVPTRRVLTGKTTGFVNDVGSLFFGLMLIGYCISHAAMLFTLSPQSNPVGDTAGWLLYLVVLTESNDIAQALWGRQIGRHKVTPTVSPNKTWEGLLFGMGTTVILAVLIAPWITPLAGSHPSRWPEMSVSIPYLWAFFAGLLIALGGFIGDITMSAVKRDAGVKDSSSLLPGQGGVLDRLDSLSFTAPLFFYYVRFLYGD